MAENNANMGWGDREGVPDERQRAEPLLTRRRRGRQRTREVVLGVQQQLVRTSHAALHLAHVEVEQRARVLRARLRAGNENCHRIFPSLCGRHA